MLIVYIDRSLPPGKTHNKWFLKELSGNCYIDLLCTIVSVFHSDMPEIVSHVSTRHENVKYSERLGYAGNIDQANNTYNT